MLRTVFGMIVLLALAGLSFVGAVTGGGRAAWFLFGCLAGLSAVGLAAGFAIRGKIAVERTVAETLLCRGDSLLVEGKVRLPFRFPFVFVILADTWRNERTGKSARGGVLLVPMGRRELSFAYRIPHLDRGVYRLAATEAGAADFLGLAGIRERDGMAKGKWFRGKEAGKDGEKGATGTRGKAPMQEIPADLSVVVGPLPASLESGPDGPALREDPATAGSVRLYAEGDPVGRIDWRSSLRSGRLMVKTPETGDECVIRLWIDPGRDDFDFERALGAARAFVLRMEHEFRSSGERQWQVMMAGDEAESPPEDGVRPLMRRLAMANREAFSGLPVNSGRFRGEGSVVLATGRMDQGLAELAMEWSAAAGSAVVALTGDRPPGEQELVMAERLERAGIGVSFANLLRPVAEQGNRAAIRPGERQMSM